MANPHMNTPILYMGRLKPIKDIPDGFYDIFEQKRYVIATNQPRDMIAPAIHQFLVQLGFLSEDISKKIVEKEIGVKKIK